MVVQAAVLAQRLGVPGTQLAQGHIHEPPPLRRPRPDEEQVLRREKHRVQHIAERRAVFGLHTVDGHAPPLAAAEPDVGDEFPLAGEYLSHQQRVLPLKADQLPVAVGAGTFAAAQVHDGLQQVGLALGVLAVDDVAAVVEGQLLALIVPPALQRQRVNSHTPRSVPDRCSPPRRRGVSSCPAWCIPDR